MNRQQTRNCRIMEVEINDCVEKENPQEMDEDVFRKHVKMLKRKYTKTIREVEKYTAREIDQKRLKKMDQVVKVFLDQARKVLGSVLEKDFGPPTPPQKCAKLKICAKLHT